ncbi:hypothetical protein [Nocardiopsis dassonvillei]|uniref:hypothetical protein n=1 Tax=Nocardiopsis dassonvillei TaxID=2014 RepID=UPI00157D4295|nr:hypothetical protein [Nocardiopsis dassonvillei]
MSRTRPRYALLTWVLAALFLCVLPSPALAAEPDTSVGSVAEITDLSRVERIAGELEESPLYVHHELRGQWSQRSLEEVEARLASGPLADLSVRVVVYPSVPGDETAGRPALFLRALHEVSGRDGVYVAVTRDHRVAFATFDSPLRVPDVDPEGLGLGYAARTHQILDLLEEASLGPETSVALTRGAPSDEGEAVRRPRGDAERFWFAALFPGALLGLVLVGVRVLFSRPSTWQPLSWPPQPLRPLRALVARLRSRIAGFRSWSAGLRAAAENPYRARWAPNRPWRWWLRPVLGRELRRLRLLVEAAPADHPERARAVEAYDAAGLIAQSPDLPPQAMVCAVVVARNGVQLMRHPGLPLLEPCQFNPLHGAGNIRLREYRYRRRLTWWQLCDRCARRRRDPRFGLFTPSLPLLVNGDPTHYRHAEDVWAEAATAPDRAFARIRTELEV